MELLTPFKLGRVELRNRVVMAPMTRSRAVENVPNALMRQYYEQRASAGLIITEGTSPSPNGLGYPRIPGLFSQAQTAGWRSITDAVHQQGGHIFAQLMHVGRIAHPLNMPDRAQILAPSALQAEGQMYTDAEGMKDFGPPKAMTAQDIHQAQQEFVQAARHAIEAGFDGIELHAANGYLLEQFMHPHANRRTDDYGGSDEARNRFVLEVVDATKEAIGADRVGIRLSPYNTFNGMARREQAAAAYSHLANNLNGIAYVHVVASDHPEFSATLASLRAAFSGPLILNGGFDADRAERTLSSGEADLISFGRPFISNPDFVHRVAQDAPLAQPDPDTFYTPGPEGYVDYATL